MPLMNYVSDFCTEVNELCQTLVSKITPSSPAAKANSQHNGHDIVQKRNSSEKPKDDARRTHERLHQELDKVQQQYKKLKGVVDQLATEYEQSKDFDFFRRYGILKGMIKRSIMHLKVAKEGSETSNVDGSAAIRLTEEKKKRELKYEDLTNEEINQDNEKIQELIKEYRRKISMIRDLIENMDRDYEASKRFVVVQRYRLLKNMTKIVITNKYI